MKWLPIVFCVLFCSCDYVESSSKNEGQLNNQEAQLNELGEKLVEEIESGLDQYSYNSEIDESVTIREVSVYRRYVGSSDNIEPEVSIKIDFTNISNREIKYLYFKYRAKNGVGDYINSDDVIDPTFEESKATGPFKPRAKDYDQYKFAEKIYLDNGEYWWKHENRWRNYNISEVEIMVSKIEFMDGTIIQGHGKTYADIVRKWSYNY